MRNQGKVNPAQCANSAAGQGGMLVELIEIKAFLANRLTATNFQIADDGHKLLGIAPDQIKPDATGGERRAAD